MQSTPSAIREEFEGAPAAPRKEQQGLQDPWTSWWCPRPTSGAFAVPTVRQGSARDQAAEPLRGQSRARLLVRLFSSNSSPPRTCGCSTTTLGRGNKKQLDPTRHVSSATTWRPGTGGEDGGGVALRMYPEHRRTLPPPQQKEMRHPEESQEGGEAGHQVGASSPFLPPPPRARATPQPRAPYIGGRGLLHLHTTAPAGHQATTTAPYLVSCTYNFCPVFLR